MIEVKCYMYIIFYNRDLLTMQSNTNKYLSMNNIKLKT